MTTTVTTASSGPLYANLTAAIPFTFQSLSGDEIEVTRNGVVAPRNSYTVARNKDIGTGSIIPNTSWGSDEVFIYSKPHFTQPVSFQRFGAWYPDQINPALDRLARYILALKREIDAKTGGGSGTGGGIGGSFGAQLFATSALTDAKTLLQLSKGDVGLGNVNNTSDADKPVSTAQATAIDLKLNASVVGQINGVAPLGADGKVPAAFLPTLSTGGSGGAVDSVNGKTGAVNLGKTDVGLANVDNTSDAAKPVSTAQQTALNAKLNKAGDTMTGPLVVPTRVTARRPTSSGEPMFLLDNESGFRLGALYYDAGDAGLKLRRYNGLGSGAAFGELAIYANDVRFNNISLLNQTGTTVSYTDEQVRDVVAAMLAAGTHSGITFTNDDSGDRMNVTVAGGVGGSAGAGFIDPGPSNGSNDEAALLTAIQAAQGGAGIINGMGRIYRINGDFVINGYSNVTIENCHFVQAAGSNGNYKMFHVINGNAWKIRNCRFEIGTNSMAGWGALDNSYGLLIEGGAAHRIIDVEVFGYGKGTGMGMKYCRNSWITSPYIHDIEYSDSSINNDTIEGLDLTFCSNIIVDSPRIKNFRGNGVNVNTRFANSDFIAIQHTRGISISGSNDITINSPDIQLVGQGIDVSGDEGNWRIKINGGRYYMMALFAEKFANSAASCTTNDAFIERVGYAGIVCSGVGSTMSAAKSATHTNANPDLVSSIQSTRNITINGMVCASPGFGITMTEGQIRFGQRAGGLVLEGNPGNGGAHPQGIRFNNCYIYNLDGNPTHGLFADGSIAVSNPINEFNTQIVPGNIAVKAANFGNVYS